MKRDDTTRIRHVLDACREIIAFTTGRGKDNIQQDRVLTLALVKEIEIIGEAASKISAEKKGELTEIPWRAIIGMRNHLIHAYDEIDMDILWDTITNDIPQLISKLGKLPGLGSI
jgi:uncharacterized protein with HEPN domain